MEKIELKEQAEIKDTTDTTDTAEVTMKAVPAQKDDTHYKINSPIRIKVDDEMKHRILDLIAREMSAIATEYSEFEYYDKILAADEEKENVRKEVDYPIDGASNRRVPLTAIAVDVVVAKAKRQTFTPAPLILIEQAERQKDGKEIPAELRDRADDLDFKLRNEIKLDELDVPFYQYACWHGAAVVKVPFVHETEWLTFKETYRGGDVVDISRFEKDYADALLNNASEEHKLWLRLRKGEDIEVVSEREVMTAHKPIPYRVPLNKFFARLSIKDFARHRVIAEQMDYAWMDIHTRVEGGYYDKEAVEELKQKYSKDEQGEIDREYERKSYKVFECVVRMDLEDNGKYKRYVVTYDEESQIIFRVIHFPYNHNKVFYVNYTCFPRDDSWLGYSFYSKLRDLTEVANSFLNSAINEITLSHSPVILTDDTKFAGDRQTIENLSVLKFQKGSQFTPVKLEYSGQDRMGFISWIQNMVELAVGVSAALMSGRESPTDPRAPASKTAMKLQESNARVEDIVLNLQKGDEALAEQVDALYEQYPTGDRESQEPYNMAVKNYRYICQGSRLSFDLSLDLQIAMQLWQFMSQMFPEVVQDANARHTMLSIILNASSGSVEKNKDVLLAPAKNAIDAGGELTRRWNEMKSSGRTPTPEENKEMLELAKAAGVPMGNMEGK